METCILEYLYYSSKSRGIIGSVRGCYEAKCSTGDMSKCKEACVKEEGIKRFEELKGQVTAMIEVSKREIKDS